MKTVWEYSLETEALRLIHCARQMAVGFYRVNNFIVLPYTPKVNNDLTVTFPDLRYNEIPAFWEKVRKIDISIIPIPADPKLVSAVKEILKNQLAEIDFRDIKNLWTKTEKEIVAQIYKIIPSKKGAIKKLTIYPTSFGTSSSFNFITKKGEIALYIRSDSGIHTITEALVTSLTRAEIYKDLGGVWQESEIITDWLITKSSLANKLKKYERQERYIPTLKGTRLKQQAKLLVESEIFYKKLGLPTTKNVFGLNGKTPEIYKRPIENLSVKEKTILRLLILKMDNTVTVDEIGENIFQTTDNFSLYAISKTIERLRRKLELNGISGSYIQTLRGKGYVLKN